MEVKAFIHVLKMYFYDFERPGIFGISNYFVGQIFSKSIEWRLSRTNQNEWDPYSH
jgi:hypothetical protein